MPSIEKLIEERKRKRDQIIDAGMEVYPVSCNRTHQIATVVSDFDELEENQQEFWVAGRILAIREHGSVVFFDLFDGSGEIQVVLKEDNFDNKNEFTLFLDAVDVGDFVEVSGKAMETRTGQDSVTANEWQMLSKALRPIPSRWSGLEDTETRLRKRYIDILMNEEVREMVEQRSRFWRSIRDFFQQRDFLEVQTPVLETTPGGADARAFKSHHNALDIDVYLRISAGELWQKKLLVGGLQKVFEVGRIFRNEGISPEHAQDYMQMEFYWAYADHEDGKELVRKLYRHVARSVFDTTEFEIHGHQVDLSDDWQEYDYVETIEDMTGCNVESENIEEITSTLRQHDLETDDEINRQRAIDTLWKYCRKQISGPAFLVNVPTEMSPLAKTQEDDSDTVAQFQPLIAGSEVGKGYSELNNPSEQRRRLQEQQKLREEGDLEAQRLDENFVEALEYGMPPACGFGVSERLFAFLLDKPIREAQIFPLLRPEDK